jgi:hypothetical protein
MDTTPNLSLPYLQANQSQKHVTLAESLQTLDAVIHIAVPDASSDTPPASPAEGERAVIGDSPTGDWSGHAGELAQYVDGAWRFHVPQRGWLCHVISSGRILVFDGASWLEPTLPDMTALFGINATADTTNRLTVSSPETLLTHEGDSHRLTLNRAGTGDHATLVLKTDYATDAEFGMAGTDGLVVKVANDAGTLKELWRGAVHPTSGSAQILIGTSTPIDDKAPIEIHNSGITAIFNREAASGGVMMGFHHQGVRRGLISVGAGGNTYMDGDPELVLRSEGTNRIHINADRVELEVPLKLDAVLSGALPDAATAGTGALLYLSSGGTVGLIYSDGSVWRRVADDSAV